MVGGEDFRGGGGGLRGTPVHCFNLANAKVEKVGV